INAAAEVNAD
ncbi:hypothetical protein Tco_0849349, partial [Tanacetum coccineum]